MSRLQALKIGIGNTSFSQSKESLPILYVDVNLGAGKTERISVYTGDTAADLAVKFSREHSINLLQVQRIYLTYLQI